MSANEGRTTRARATAPSASQRACRRWGECALYVRGELRALGVRGDLRRLDDYVRGERGAGVTRFLADFATYCAAHGLSRESCAARLADLTMGVVSDAYSERSGDSAA